MTKIISNELVLATHNAGKVREISEMLSPYVEHFYSAAELNLPEPEETETTFEGNALLKARAAAQASGKPALADDSGLAVEALGGQPGIHSARWAYAPDSDERDFSYAMGRVLEDLAPHDNRRASFVCALALVHPDGEEHCFTGYVHGVIADAPRGEGGFGYDPIFIPDGYDQTFGEFDPADKHAISHRANAFEKMIEAVS